MRCGWLSRSSTSRPERSGSPACKGSEPGSGTGDRMDHLPRRPWMSARVAGLDDTDRAADAGAAEAAVAVRDLVQVLLVVVLGVVERAGLARRACVRSDLAELELVEQRLVRGAGRLVRLLLLLGGPVHGRAVLGADVVALAVALGRVVRLPERPEQLLGGDALRVVRHQHSLGVAGAGRAGLLVGRVGRVAALVADRGGHDAGQLPEDALGAPEAAH